MIPIPWSIAKIQGILFGLMPKPILTLDQVKSLKSDNIVEEPALKLEDMGVQPTPMNAILPQYLSCYRKGGRFSNKKAA